MATVKELTNVKVCGAANTIGSNNSKGCSFDFKDIAAVGVIHPSAKFESSNDFNEQAIKDLQISGKLEMFKGVDDVEFTGGDDTINTSGKGVNSKSIKGLYQLKLSFLEDLYFQSSITSYDGFKNWNTFLIDSAGNMLFTKKSNGDWYGFSTGMLSAGKYVFGGTESNKAYLEFQWLNRNELDTDFVFVDNSILDFNPLEIEGVAQTEVSFTSVPAASDTSIVVEARLSRGGEVTDNVFVAAANWKVLLNGTTQVLTTAAFADGKYTLSPVASVSTGDKLTVSLNGTVDIVGDCLYKSNTEEITAV